MIYIRPIYKLSQAKLRLIGSRFVAPMLLTLVMPLIVQVEAAPIPADVFPSIEFDTALQDTYSTGEPLLLQGQVSDLSKANGRILFKFTPRSGGDEIRHYIDLEGTRFSVYQIFLHDQSGVYDLDIYLGEPGEGLPWVGGYDGMEILQGSGEILLPTDFFPGIVLDQELPTQIVTGEHLLLQGQVSDLSKANGRNPFSQGDDGDTTF